MRIAVHGLGEECRRQVVAARGTRQHVAAADKPCAFALSDLDVVKVLLELALVDHGPDLGAGLQRVVHDEAHDALAQRLDKAVVDAFGDHQS